MFFFSVIEKKKGYAPWAPLLSEWKGGRAQLAVETDWEREVEKEG